jgi:hypothetical protein
MANTFLDWVTQQLAPGTGLPATPPGAPLPSAGDVLAALPGVAVKQVVNTLVPPLAALPALQASQAVGEAGAGTTLAPLLSGQAHTPAESLGYGLGRAIALARQAGPAAAVADAQQAWQQAPDPGGLPVVKGVLQAPFDPLNYIGGPAARGLRAGAEAVGPASTVGRGLLAGATANEAYAGAVAQALGLLGKGAGGAWEATLGKLPGVGGWLDESPWSALQTLRGQAGQASTGLQDLAARGVAPPEAASPFRYLAGTGDPWAEQGTAAAIQRRAGLSTSAREAGVDLAQVPDAQLKQVLNHGQQDLRELDALRAQLQLPDLSGQGADRPIGEVLQAAQAAAPDADPQGLLAQASQIAQEQGLPRVRTTIQGRRTTQELVGSVNQVETVNDVAKALQATRATPEEIRLAQAQFLADRYGDVFPVTAGTQHQYNAVAQRLAREGPTPSVVQGAPAESAPPSTPGEIAQQLADDRAAAAQPPESAAPGIPMGRARIDRAKLQEGLDMGLSRDAAMDRARVGLDLGDAGAPAGPSVLEPAAGPATLPAAGAPPLAPASAAAESPLAAAGPTSGGAGVEGRVAPPLVSATGASGTPYDLRYKVVSLDDLIPSQTDTLAANPQYPAALQPRLRDRAVSRQQIDEIARTLDPRRLLVDSGELDRGPLIVGPDNFVESGNGRALALRLARTEYPDRYASYVQELQQRLPDYGLPADAIQGIRDPVLVRERVTPLSDAARASFAVEANQPSVLGLSATEQALADARSLPDNLLAAINPGNGTLEQQLNAASNRPAVRQWLSTLPTTAQASLVTSEGALNQAGANRLANALFARTFPDEAGQRLTTAFRENLDPTLKNVQTALQDALPDLLPLHGTPYDLAPDLAPAVDVLARLRQQGVAVPDYLSQASLWERELTPFQEQLVQFLDTNIRSAGRLRDTLRAYAQTARAPTFEQAGQSKGALLDAAASRYSQQPTLFGSTEAQAPAAAAPGPQLAGEAGGLGSSAGPLGEPPTAAEQPPLIGGGTVAPAASLSPQDLGALHGVHPDVLQQMQAAAPGLIDSFTRDQATWQRVSQQLTALGAEAPTTLGAAAQQALALSRGGSVAGATLKPLLNDAKTLLYRYGDTNLADAAAEPQALLHAFLQDRSQALGNPQPLSLPVISGVMQVLRHLDLFSGSYPLKVIADSLLHSAAFTGRLGIPDLGTNLLRAVATGEEAGLGPTAAAAFQERGLVPPADLFRSSLAAEMGHLAGPETASAPATTSEALGQIGQQAQQSAQTLLTSPGEGLKNAALWTKNVSEEIARTASSSARAAGFLQGYDATAARQADALAGRLQSIVGGTEGAQIAQAVRDGQGIVAPDLLQTWLEQAGVEGDAARSAFAALSDHIATARQAGLAMAQRFSVGAPTLTNLDEALRTAIPFHVFATRSAPRILEMFLTNPWTWRLFKSYHDATQQYDQQEGILPGTALADKVPVFDIGGTKVYLNPLQYFAEDRYFRQPFPSPKATPIGNAYQRLEQVGLGLAPWAAKPLEMTGALGPKPPGEVTPLDAEVGAVLQALRGQPSPLPWEQLGNVRFGPRSGLPGGTIAPGADTYNPNTETNKRVAELSIERTGTVNQPDYVAAMNNPGESHLPGRGPAGRGAGDRPRWSRTGRACRSRAPPDRSADPGGAWRACPR